MGVETELKLDLTADAAQELIRAAPFGAPEKVVTQQSTYFDTDDRLLRARGVTLRIRRSGEVRVQTLKAAGTGAVGLKRRGEWERAVDGDVPVIDDPDGLALLDGLAADRLTPLFEIKVERRLWQIEEGGARIEMVQDQGRALAGGREAAFDELELEQMAGDPAALFAIARRIDAVAPVHLGVLTKAERGDRLLEAAAKSVKASPIELGGVDTTAALAQAVAAECLRQFRLNETILIERSTPHALHQARVALRRLRSALSIFRRMLASPALDRFRADFRWLAAELGRARDLDVLIERSPPGPVHDRFVAAREETYDAVLATLGGGRARHLVLDFAEWMSVGAWLTEPSVRRRCEEQPRDFADRALDKLRRRVRDEGRDLVHRSDEGRHELRKSAKKLRYAAEFFAPLLTAKRERKRHARFLDALEELQDELGALNDLATAPALLASLGITGDALAAALPQPGEKEQRLEKAAAAHEKLVEAKRSWR